MKEKDLKKKLIAKEIEVYNKMDWALETESHKKQLIIQVVIIASVFVLAIAILISHLVSS